MNIMRRCGGTSTQARDKALRCDLSGLSLSRSLIAAESTATRMARWRRVGNELFILQRWERYGGRMTSFCRGGGHLLLTKSTIDDRMRAGICIVARQSNRGCPPRAHIPVKDPPSKGQKIDRYIHTYIHTYVDTCLFIPLSHQVMALLCGSRGSREHSPPIMSFLPVDQAAQAGSTYRQGPQNGGGARHAELGLISRGPHILHGPRLEILLLYLCTYA